MINTHELKKRDSYLNKIKAFQDTEPVKVVTGICRCGKTSLLKLMVEHLKETGVTDNQIIEMNFESYEFGKMTSDVFYDYVKGRILPDKRMYLFFDVAIGKIDSAEVDFIAAKTDTEIYVQVTESMANPDVRKREFAPLRKINDNYEKTVLSLDTEYEETFEGIKPLNLIKRLLNKS